MSESLGKAVLELTADLAPFEKNMRAAKRSGDDMQHGLDAIVAVARVAEIELNKVKLDAATGAKSKEIADRIERSVGSVGKAAMEASRHLEKVKLDATNAAETRAAGDAIDRKLKDVTGNANEARRALESVRLAGAGAGGAGGSGRNPGVGVGPFGSGFGRIGLLDTAIGGGALLGPAGGPAAVGLLAAVPVLATTGAGALGALALAFQGVGKAIEGDKKAFDALVPAQQAFVLQIRSLTGWLDKLKQTAASNMFPGLTEGLHSALSPGTLAAVTRAVTEFAKAIGQAGAAWGKYFGSREFQSIFGPLMQAGAKNLTLMSSAALHLFDAIGVLARAAIPLTSWMVQSVDTASRWADSWMHAKEATGQLGHAMDEAKTSLQLVGGLLAALLRAVAALGAALYPVSKVAVKDLTDGLNALAGIIRRNEESIRQIVGGALAAFVAAVKGAAAVVKDLWPALQKVVDLLGGWKSVFEDVIALKIASVVSGWASSFMKLAGAEALGGAEAKSAGLLTNLTRLKLIGPIAIAVALDLVPTSSKGQSALDQTAFGFLGHLPVVGGVASQGGALGDWLRQQLGKGSLAGQQADPAIAARNMARDAADIAKLRMSTPAGLRQAAAAAASMYGVPGGLFAAQINQESGFNPNARSSAGALGIAQFMPGTAKGYGINPLNPSQALPAAAKMMSQLYAKYGNWSLALAAYNAGSGTVDKYLAGKGSLPGETQAYVKSIFGAAGSNWQTNFGQPATSQPSPFGTDPPWTKNVPKPKKVPWKGATQATIITALGRVSATLKAAPDVLDPAEANAVMHIEKLRDKLHIHMSAADLATDKVELAKWGKVLHEEITKNAKAAAAAAAESKKLFNRALTLDVSTILRDQQEKFAAQKKAFDTVTSRQLKDMQTAFSIQSKAFNTETSRTIKDMQALFAAEILKFDRETQRHLAAMVVVQTPDEKAYTDFVAKRAADDLAKSRADQLANAATPEEKAALALGFSLDDQETALQAAADKSRAAQDAKTTADQQAYQDQRDAQRQALQDAETDRQQAYQDDRTSQLQALQDKETDLEQAYQDQRDLQWQSLQDINDDQKTRLQDNLNDWTAWLAAKQKTFADFAAWAAGHGIDTGQLVDPALAALTGGAALAPIPGTLAAAVAGGARITHQLPKLDTGGYVERTGLAVVHRGETWSGVGPGRGSGMNVNVYPQGSVIAERDLATTIVKALQDYQRTGGLITGFAS